MQKSTLTLLCLLWVLIPHTAIAGGSSWEYQVINFKKTSPTSAEFSLRPTRREQNYPRREFLKLYQQVVEIDLSGYYINNIGKILGILSHILTE